MVKAEWGTKRTCPKCGTRFYDLGKEDPVTCIECGVNWLPEPALKSKQPLPYEVAKAEKLAADKADSDLADDEMEEDLPDEEAEQNPDDEVDLGGDEEIDLGGADKDDEER